MCTIRCYIWRHVFYIGFSWYCQSDAPFTLDLSDFTNDHNTLINSDERVAISRLRSGHHFMCSCIQSSSCPQSQHYLCCMDQHIAPLILQQCPRIEHRQKCGQFIEKAVRHDWRTEDDGVLHGCGQCASVRQEEVNGSTIIYMYD